MKRIIIIFLLLLTNISFFGQKTKNWKEIKPEDFNITYFDDFTESAIILDESVRYYFEEKNGQFCLQHEVTKKIRINDEDGLQYGHFDIYLNKNENIENISRIQAFTYVYENGEIKSYKLKSKNQKTTKINDYKYKISVEMPEVKAGAIIVYKYTISSFDIVKPVEIFVQHNIPCIKSEIELRIPEFLNYQINFLASDYLANNKLTEMTEVYNYNFNLQSINVDNMMSNQGGTLINTSFRVKTKKYVFEFKDIPAKENEYFVDNIDNYTAKIELFLQSVSTKNNLIKEIDEFAWIKFTKNLFIVAEKYYPLMKKNGSKYSRLPISFIVFYENDWSKFDIFLYKSYLFGKQLSKIWNYQDEYNKALTNVDDNSLSKMIALYDYVRKNYIWNGEYSSFMSKKIAKISKLKVGNSADINIVLISLLQRAGLEAFPVILRTVDKGHIDKSFASAIQFNHVIAGVEINNKKYFLDAINSENPWYILDSNDLNIEGRMLKAQNSDFIKIIPNVKTSEIDTFDVKIDGNTADCELKTYFSGYWAFQKSNSLDSFFYSFKKRITDITDFKSSFDDSKINMGKLSTKISFKTNEIVKGKEIDAFKVFEIYCYFLSLSRNADIYFGFPCEKRYVVKIHIPSNKKVVSFPKNYIKQINGAKLSATSNVERNTIIFDVDFVFEKSSYNVKNGYDIRELFLKYCDFSISPVVVE